MNAMSDRERAALYRRRKAAREIAEELFDGKEALTLAEFLAVADVAFNRDEFLDLIDGLGEESSDYQEEREEVWQEAYNEAYREAYDESFSKVLQELRDEEPDAEDLEARAAEIAQDDDAVIEAANESAAEAVADWAAEQGDYNLNAIEYELHDLLDAYRESNSLTA
jgi:hypothetical protein